MAATTTTSSMQTATPERHELESMPGEMNGSTSSSTAIDESPATEPNHHVTETGPSIIEVTAPQVKLKICSAAFCFFNAGVSDGSLGALIPYILPHYAISTRSMAVPYAISFVGWLAAALLVGYMRLCLGSGGVLLSGAFLQLLAQVLRVWTPPFALLAFSFFPLCLGQGLQDSQANIFVSLLVDGAHRWLAVIHGSYAVGGLCGPLIASAIAANFDGHWAAFYYVPAVMGAFNLALCSYAFWDEMAWKSANAIWEQRPSRTALVELKGAVRQKSVWFLSLFFFLYIGAALTIGGRVVEFLVVVRQGNLSTVGYIGAAFMGGTALGRFTLAEPTFRFGEKRMVSLYSIICLILQIVFWRVPSIVANAVIVCIMGFFLGPFFATGVSVGSKLIPQELQQPGLALVFVMAQAGGAMFPAITGIIAAGSGVGTLQPILVGVLAALAISWLAVPSPANRSPAT